eukprot:TRINITY_DN4884_c0_g1_i1.p1 TRINITY_DN4884_c0_g1~~TRINITY_DN4884_c0_g1_i1.p1  ORF type:complete len:346 (-),score=89.10 TRINITY_DN4884_c0_g1_i1:18-1055(-)
MAKTFFLLLFISMTIGELVGYYGFEEGSGQVAFDSSRMQNHMIFSPRGSRNVFSNDGKVGRSKGPVGCGWVYGYLNNDFTIMFWMKQSNTQFNEATQWWQGAGLVDGELPGAQDDFGVALMGSKVGFGVGPTDITLISPVTVTDGVWHHIVASRSVITDASQITTTVLRLYIDGVLSVSNTTGSADLLPRIPPTLAVGCLATDINYFSGSLDQVRLYSHTVTDNEILRVFNQEKNGASFTDIPSTSSSTILASLTRPTRVSTSTSEEITSEVDQVPQPARPGNIPTKNTTVIALSIVGTFVAVMFIAFIVFIVYNRNKAYVANRDQNDKQEQELEEKATKEAQTA